MPIKNNGPKIKPQPKITFETCTFKADGATLIRLKAYCEFIDSEQSYVIREALNYLFQSDPSFQSYLETKNVNPDAGNAAATITARAEA